MSSSIPLTKLVPEMVLPLPSVLVLAKLEPYVSVALVAPTLFGAEPYISAVKVMSCVLLPPTIADAFSCGWDNVPPNPAP